MQLHVGSQIDKSRELEDALRLERLYLKRCRQCWRIGSCFGASLILIALLFAIPIAIGIRPSPRFIAPLGGLSVLLLLWALVVLLICVRTRSRLDRLVKEMGPFPLLPLDFGEQFGSQHVSRLDDLGIEFEHRISPTTQLALKWSTGVVAASIALALIANMAGILAYSQPTKVFSLLVAVSLFLGVWAMFPTPCRCSLARPSPSSDFVLTWTDASILYQVRHILVRFDGYSNVEIHPEGRHLFVKVDDGQLESIVSVANTPLSSWHLTRVELALLEVLGQDIPDDEDDENEDEDA